LQLRECSGSSAASSYCSGGLRPNSGEVVCNRRGEEVEEVQEGEENLLVCRNRPGSVGIYRGEGWPRVRSRSSMASAFQGGEGASDGRGVFLVSR
jgi:hypothetical protein